MLKVQQDIQVQKRDGRLVSFDIELILKAIQKAFCAERQLNDPSQLDDVTAGKVELMVDNIVGQLNSMTLSEKGVEVESIQDMVERELMRYEYFSVARRYILYRAEHTRMRQLRAEENMESDQPFPTLMVKRDGKLENFDFEKLARQIRTACLGLEGDCDPELLINETKKQLNPIQLCHFELLTDFT